MIDIRFAVNVFWVALICNAPPMRGTNAFQRKRASAQKGTGDAVNDMLGIFKYDIGI